MKNSFGSSLVITLFGESHGEKIGFVLDGLAPGLEISGESIKRALARRRPSGKISTPRREEDDFSIVSGMVNGRATGTPLCLLIENTNTKSSDYTSMPLRPGHADFTAEMKYHGYQDARGGGHFSGRITAAIVAAGAIASDALFKKGILIGSHIKELAGIADRDFEDVKKELPLLNQMNFATLSEEAGDKMQEAILAAAEEGDSVGGIIETCVIGLPAGVGEPWFDTLEGTLSHALFSIPAVKGVQFGAGFGFAKMRGSEANDAFYLDEGKIQTKTNHNGGLGGGISNGMPILFSLAVKPTPTIAKEQSTVDLKTKKECTLSAKGRHDPAIVHRACPVVDAITALVIYDALASRFGTDFFAPEN